MFREKAAPKPESTLKAKILQGKNFEEENFQQKTTQPQAVINRVDQMGGNICKNLTKLSTTGPAQPTHQPQDELKVNPSPSPACRRPPKKGIKKLNPSKVSCHPISSYFKPLTKFPKDESESTKPPDSK